MSRSPVRYRNQMIFRSFINFYDAVLECDGVTAIRTGGMSSVGSHEASLQRTAYDSTTHEMKVDAKSRDGLQEFRIRVDPQKAKDVYEYIQRYNGK